MTFHKTCIELKYIEQNYNSIDFKFNSSYVCMAYNGLHHFPMSSLFWFYPKQSTAIFLLFSTKSTKLVEPQLLKVTKF